MCTLHILYNVLCPLPFVLVYFFFVFLFSVYFLFMLIQQRHRDSRRLIIFLLPCFLISKGISDYAKRYS